MVSMSGVRVLRAAGSARGARGPRISGLRRRGAHRSRAAQCLLECEPHARIGRHALVLVVGVSECSLKLPLLETPPRNSDIDKTIKNERIVIIGLVTHVARDPDDVRDKSAPAH